MECVSKKVGNKRKSLDQGKHLQFSPLKKDDHSQPRPRVYIPVVPEEPKEQKPDEDKPERGVWIITPDNKVIKGVITGNSKLETGNA